MLLRKRVLFEVFCYVVEFDLLDRISVRASSFSVTFLFGCLLGFVLEFCLWILLMTAFMSVGFVGRGVGVAALEVL